MDFEVYCDESNQELLCSAGRTPRAPLSEESSRFFLIGGLWLPAAKRSSMKARIREARLRHGCFGEAKWRSISPSQLPFYLDIIDIFFEAGADINFRCIAIDSRTVDLSRYHQADQELGYYKFCYQLLKHWTEDFCSYRVFLDTKTNRLRTRLQTLRHFLQAANLLAEVKSVQAVPSRESPLIQLTDVLLGATAAKFNSITTSQSKLEAIHRVESHLGHPIAPTTRWVRKFNVFKIRLQ